MTEMELAYKKTRLATTFITQVFEQAKAEKGLTDKDITDKLGVPAFFIDDVAGGNLQAIFSVAEVLGLNFIFRFKPMETE